MKKKGLASSKDKKDWLDFVDNMDNIGAKEVDSQYRNIDVNRYRKLDLHGFSLSEANEAVKKFIIESYEEGYTKLRIITGKGLRSKSGKNPYLSEKFSVLKYSVPEYVKNDENLNYKVKKIIQAEPNEGGEGAFNIFLKKNKKFIK